MIDIQEVRTVPTLEVAGRFEDVLEGAPRQALERVLAGFLLAAIGNRREFATREGQIRAFPTSAFAGLRGDQGQPLPVVRGPASSSNSLVFYGRLALKLFRRLEVGVNPDYEVGEFLTEVSP